MGQEEVNDPVKLLPRLDADLELCCDISVGTIRVLEQSGAHVPQIQQGLYTEEKKEEAQKKINAFYELIKVVEDGKLIKYSLTSLDRFMLEDGFSPLENRLVVDIEDDQFDLNGLVGALAVRGDARVTVYNEEADLEVDKNYRMMQTPTYDTCGGLTFRVYVRSMLP